MPARKIDHTISVWSDCCGKEPKDFVTFTDSLIPSCISAYTCVPSLSQRQDLLFLGVSRKMAEKRSNKKQVDYEVAGKEGDFPSPKIVREKRKKSSLFCYLGVFFCAEFTIR